MVTQDTKSIERYKFHLALTSEWMLRSVEYGKGGSCAHFSPWLGWSKPYPETTGYMIPTLIRVGHFLREEKYFDAAKNIGEWLLSIQYEDGSWHGGLHPNEGAPGSVFNTGQILKGMIALYNHTDDQRYIDAANNGANWLAAGVGSDGLWPAGDYQAKKTPSYYTHVAWPMLEVWNASRNSAHREAAERHLDAVLERRLPNGAIGGWGFKDTGSAFSHTIAYTIRGFQESSRLINDYDRFAKPMEQALEFFVKKAELTSGRLPGEFDEELKATGSYVCLTGNAQLAICTLLMEQHDSDLRLVNAAAKMTDFVGKVQRNSPGLSGMKGGVAGSYPLWGRYMIMRYPNWAAKYYCDALLLLVCRLGEELK